MAQTNEPSGKRLIDADVVNALADGQSFTTADAITAAGSSSRTGATQLQYNAITRIGTAAANTGVILPSAQSGSWMIVINDGASTLTVYGLGSDTINGTAGSTGVTQATTQAALYACVTTAKWSRVLTA